MFDGFLRKLFGSSNERRIRAFSEFSSEPPVCPEPIDLHQIVEERIAFLKSAHPEVRYAVEVAENAPNAIAVQRPSQRGSASMANIAATTNNVSRPSVMNVRFMSWNNGMPSRSTTPAIPAAIDRDRLSRERHDVRLLHFHTRGGDAPFRIR